MPPPPPTHGGESTIVSGDVATGHIWGVLGSLPTFDESNELNSSRRSVFGLVVVVVLVVVVQIDDDFELLLLLLLLQPLLFMLLIQDDVVLITFELLFISRVRLGTLP